MELRLLLDEDTERSLARKLSGTGHDVERVVAVDALGQGSSDAEMRRYAVETDRVIVTHDDDFLTVPVDSHAGVFYAPNQRLSAQQTFDIVQSVVESYQSREQM